MKDYKTYIFDLDGTLLNTIDDLAAAVNYALKNNNQPCISTKEVLSYVGNGVEKLIERSVSGGKNNESFLNVYDDFKRYYHKHETDLTMPYDGILDMLRTLKQHKKNIAIVSNKFDAAVKSLCKHFFADYISVAIGETNDVKHKPAPDCVFKALKELGVSKDNAVYIGDSEVDIQTAKNSGLPCISVSWGFKTENFLKDNGAECIIHLPKEITEYTH